MVRRACLSASGLLLLFVPVTTSQDPKDAQEALAQVARLEGKVKYDDKRQVVEIDL